MNIDGNGNRLAKHRRIAILGKQSVGKTSFGRILRDSALPFLEKHYPSQHAEFKKDFRIGEYAYTLDIHDTVGMENEDNINESWLDAHWAGTIDAFVIMYAINDEESFRIAKKLRAQLAYFMGLSNDNWNAPMVLLGNKRDVIDAEPSERQVSKDEVKKTVKKWSNCKYAEITCKRATEVNTIIRELITHHEQYFDYLPHEKTFTQQLQRLFGITNQQIHINTKSWTFFDSNLLVS